MKIYINGKFYDKDNAKVSVFDHGLLYGDGVFEGIRSYSRRVFKLKEHLDRLFESAQSIMLSIPLTKAQLIKAVIQTIIVNKLDDAYIRLVVTRGEGDLGLDPRKCCKGATIIIIADKIALYPQKFYSKGLNIVTVPTVRNLPEALNPQIKSLNYLNNILAKIEAANAGCDEAIMLDSLGYVAECTGDNIFVVKNGHLYTPPQCMGTLRGITRDAILEIARKGKIPAHEHVITRHEVYISDECFLTGTAAEVIPVVKVDGRVIGSGIPGKLTLSLMKKFKQLTAKDGVNIKMLCDVCGKNPATVHLTEIIDEQMNELHLCEDCARHKSAAMEQQFGLSDLLAGMADFEKPSKDEEVVTAKCHGCGLTYADFKKIGRLGCGECYNIFRRYLAPLLKRIHGSNQHVGKSPFKTKVKPAGMISKKKTNLQELKDKLQEAIKKEDFEEAARLRDQIKKISQDTK